MLFLVQAVERELDGNLRAMDNAFCKYQNHLQSDATLAQAEKAVEGLGSKLGDRVIASLHSHVGILAHGNM